MSTKGGKHPGSLALGNYDMPVAPGDNGYICLRGLTAAAVTSSSQSLIHDVRLTCQDATLNLWRTTLTSVGVRPGIRLAQAYAFRGSCPARAGWSTRREISSAQGLLGVQGSQPEATPCRKL